MSNFPPFHPASETPQLALVRYPLSLALGARHSGGAIMLHEKDAPERRAPNEFSVVPSVTASALTTFRYFRQSAGPFSRVPLTRRREVNWTFRYFRYSRSALRPLPRLRRRFRALRNFWRENWEVGGKSLMPSASEAPQRVGISGKSRAKSLMPSASKASQRREVLEPSASSRSAGRSTQD